MANSKAHKRTDTHNNCGLIIAGRENLRKLAGY